MKNIAIILASGSGKRAGLGLPKQFNKIKGKTLLEWSFGAFCQNKNIDGIILVVNPEFTALAQKILGQIDCKKPFKIVSGGKERIDSSRNGVLAVDEPEANVLIHDCVRPFVSQKIINECVETLKTNKAAGVAVDVVDTVFVCENGIMKTIPPRKFLKKSQTPQCFRLSVIKRAHELAQKVPELEFTDDCGLVLQFELAPIFIVEGDKRNIKITYADDFRYAEEIACDLENLSVNPSN